ncbi:MAG: TA system VapC family ribonuclease toxin [Bryobacteraceae bacterium]|nr:TA system VapC family ribonuclease toxin [Bryobacteraceae bacterium]
MSYLGDVNFWLALALGDHTDHAPALAWFLRVEDPVCFCRTTQMSFLRLLGNRGVVAKPFGPADSWSLYRQTLRRPNVAFASEPDRIEEVWAGHLSGWTSPNHWVDSYLAAFAISGGYTLVTFDKGFSKYRGLRYVIPA